MPFIGLKENEPGARESSSPREYGYRSLGLCPPAALKIIRIEIRRIDDFDPIGCRIKDGLVANRIDHAGHT